MRNVLTLEAFAEFCETKGQERFLYYDPRECACAQYAAQLGVNYPVIHPNHLGSFWAQAEYCAYTWARGRRDDHRITFAQVAAVARRLLANRKPAQGEMTSVDEPA